MTYYKPNTFFTSEQVESYALQMLSNHSINNVTVEVISDLNAGFCGRLETASNIFGECSHVLKLNYKALARHAMHFNVNAHQFALSVIAHELGHYMDYEHYDGFKLADIVYDSVCPIERQNAVIQLEKNAGKYARRFVTDDFREVFVNDNQKNIDHHYNKLKNLTEGMQETA